MSYVDPPEAPEGGASLRAKDLLNKPCLFRPTGEKTETGRDGKPWHFIECEVWVLDRAGVVEQAADVRISWWKAVDQLSQQMGALVGAKPIQHEDNSISLAPLSSAARDVAERVAKEIDSGEPPSTGDEPF